MKKIHFLILILSFSALSAQEVIDSLIVKIPYIGQKGGAHLLNWSLDNETNNIFIYAYSHSEGSYIISNPDQIQKAKDTYSKKNWFGKLVSSSVETNKYTNTINPIVLEKIISTDDFKEVKTTTQLFHRAENVPEGKYVYFKRNNGMIDLNFPISSGKKIKYHYSELNKAFKYSPKLNENLVSFFDIKLIGEGLLGLKNLKPHLIKKSANFKYSKQKGYISKTKKETIRNLNDISALNTSELIQNSTQSSKNTFFCWLKLKENKRDYRNFRLYKYDKISGKDFVEQITFENSRKPIILNKVVYDKNLKAKGYVSIFGYHKRASKELRGDNVKLFDIIYVDLDGNIKFQTQFSHGTDKKYKNVISPILIFDENNSLTFVNNNIQSVFKSKYEIFTLNSKGDIKIISEDDFYMVKDGKSSNLYHYLVDYNSIEKVGNYYFIQKEIVEKRSVTKQNTSIPTIENHINGYNFIVLDKELKPINVFSYLTQDAPSINSFKKQNIELNDKVASWIIKKGRYYYYLKYNNLGKIEMTNIKVPYSKYAIQNLYFGSYSNDFALVDKEKRLIFIQNQFYDFKTYQSKVIKQISITKIHY